MAKFYKNVQVLKDDILEIGVDENGRSFQRKIKFKPESFIPTSNETKYKTLDGKSVDSIIHSSIFDAREFVNQYKNISDFEIYGNNDYVYQYLSEKYMYGKPKVEWDDGKINKFFIDIETSSDNGFPNPEIAEEEITAITIRNNSEFFCWGYYGDYINTNHDLTVHYFKLSNEEDMIEHFLNFWKNNKPDVLTGWNIETFDIPYIINRSKKLNIDYRKLSPWRYIRDRNIFMNGREQKTYSIIGLSILDYLHLYKNFTYVIRDSYRLDNIANIELNERKLSFEEMQAGYTLYKSDHQKFIEYNIKDVELVYNLDKKMKLLDLVFTIAYSAGMNYNDVFSPVRTWDTIIYNYLKERNIVIPANKKHEKDHSIIGAYVKSPAPGMYNWISSFDLTSLYPHLIMQYNISPEKILEMKDLSMDESLLNDISIDNIVNEKNNLEFLKENNLTMTPNKHFFSRNECGFLPSLMNEYFNMRKKAKSRMIELQKEREVSKKPELDKEIDRLNIFQHALKITLNAAYGALANKYFRFFDTRLAEAITTSGQLSIKWIERKLNIYLNDLFDTRDENYVITCDTDSIYLNFNYIVNKYMSGEEDTNKIINFLDRLCKDKIEPFIQKKYIELAKYTNAYEQKMFMKREVLAKRGVFIAKKRYILDVYDSEGVRYTNPKLKIMGVECVRSSTPSYCRNTIKESISIILKKTENELQCYTNGFWKKYKNISLNEIAFPRSVSDIQKYEEKQEYLFDIPKATPIHVRGSLIYNDLLKVLGLEKKYSKIQNGTKIKFIYLNVPIHKMHKLPKELQKEKLYIISYTDILPDEFGLSEFIDYDTQFNKSFIDPLKTITNTINWKLTSATNTQQDLSSFF